MCVPFAFLLLRCSRIFHDSRGLLSGLGEFFSRLCPARPSIDLDVFTCSLWGEVFETFDHLARSFCSMVLALLVAVQFTKVSLALLPLDDLYL